MGTMRGVNFRDQGFAARMTVMGDPAESVFEATYPEGFARYGLNRPPINLSDVPPKIRHTPDYITRKGLVEVMGFGNDETLKLKLVKANALWAWHSDFRVDMFLWDSACHEYGWVRLPELLEVADRILKPKRFPEGHEYWPIHKALIPTAGTWVRFRADA